MTPFVQWLRAELKKPGRSQLAVAQAIGMDPSALSRALAGKRHFRDGEIEQIKSHLGSKSPRPASVALLANGMKIARATWLGMGLEGQVRGADEWIERLETDGVMIEVLQAVLERRQQQSEVPEFSSYSTSQTFGDRMRVAREQANLSMEAVGKSVAHKNRPQGAYSPQAVQQWERNQTSPDVETVAAFAELVRWDLNWLIRGRRGARTRDR
jgi:transcriptional regulator with XRE-family HTH domain